MHTIAPDDIVQTFAEAGRNARPPLLVLDPLQRFLDDRDLGAAPIMATPVGEGHSNVTILVSRDGWEGIVRRLPRPPLPAPNERHAVVPDAGAVEVAVSMKGNYRRAVAGLTDDPYCTRSASRSSSSRSARMSRPSATASRPDDDPRSAG